MLIRFKCTQNDSMWMGSNTGAIVGQHTNPVHRSSFYRCYVSTMLKWPYIRKESFTMFTFHFKPYFKELEITHFKCK